MATLEDRILGEKQHYYCSSSEDEDDGPAPGPAPPPPPSSARGAGVSNTGPKGVLHDWQCYKQAEAEARTEQDREKLELMKNLTLSCMSSAQEEEYKRQKELDDELDELLADEVLLNYQKQRMREMLEQAGRLPKFGRLINLETSDDFLNAVDTENKAVTVIVHIYEERVEACRVMNGCLISLSQDYPTVKFCKLIGSRVGVSKQFKVGGVPALLIYKAGQMIGNFVRITDTLGDDFYASDLESYLIEHGLLPDKSIIPDIVMLQNNNVYPDSDVSLD